MSKLSTSTFHRLALAMLLAFGAAAIVVAFSSAFGCSALPSSKVIDGAATVLEGLCEHAPTPMLEAARDALSAGAVHEAIRYLEAEVAEHGPQRDVMALLALLQSQIPPLPPAPTP